MGDLKKLEICYHKAVKRIAGMQTWQSNHEACKRTQLNIFKHLISKRLAQLYFLLINSSAKLIRNLRYYFLFNSNIYDYIKNRFQCFYDVDNFLFNDKDALFARINYVENNEPRSNYEVELEN